MCELLLQLGADPNAATRSGGATALHRAAYTGHLDVVQLLLAAGAVPTKQDADGQTAYHKAVQQVGWGVLCSVGWEVVHELSVLRMAVVEVVELRCLQSHAPGLQRRGSDTTPFTPLFCQGHVQVAAALLGACPEVAQIRDNRGRWAADLAPG